MVWGAIVVLWLLTNLLTWQFVPTLERTGGLVVGSLPFALAAGAMFAARRIGARNVVFSAVPVLLMLVLVEVGLRVFFANFATRQQKLDLAMPWVRGTGDAQLYLPHHYALYKLNPEVGAELGLHHNSLGLRDHREFAPDADAIRIVFIGGSTTYTHDVFDNQKIFSAGIERALNERLGAALGERRIEVINAGMGAATSAENLIRLIFFVSELAPDLVVIQHGINDVWPRAVGTLAPDYGNYRKPWAAPTIFDPRHSIAFNVTVRVARATMLGNLLLVRTRLVRPNHLGVYVNRDAGERTPELPAGNDSRYFERNTRYMIALSREMGADVVLASVAFLDDMEFRDAFLEHNALLARIAREEGVHFYDFFAEMIRDAKHMPDGLHVSQQGSDRKRDLYLAYFERAGIVDALLRRADAEGGAPPR